MFVAAVMTRPVETLDSARTASDAQELMRDRHFRHVPVVDDGHLVGIVSDRDVSDAARLLREVMHTQVISVTPDTPVESAAALMLDNKIGSLAVLDDRDELVGIVTESDLFRLLTTMLGAQEPSTRLQVRVRNLPQELSLITTLASTMGIPISSVLTEPRRGEGTARAVVLRVGTINATRFVQALLCAGIEVDAPDREAPGGDSALA